MRQLPKNYAKHVFDIFAKNMRSPANSWYFLCQPNRPGLEKKSRKQQFSLRTFSTCKYLPNIVCRNVVHKYLEPDLLGKIQLVPSLRVIIIWNKSKLNKMGGENWTCESQSRQFGQILISEPCWRAKPIVQWWAVALVGDNSSSRTQNLDRWR